MSVVVVRVGDCAGGVEPLQLLLFLLLSAVVAVTMTLSSPLLLFLLLCSLVVDARDIRRARSAACHAGAPAAVALLRVRRLADIAEQLA